MCSRASGYITHSCRSSLSIDNPLDYTDDLALKSLFPSFPGPSPPFAWPTSLKVFSLFFMCAQSFSGVPPLTKLFFLSLLLRNLLATGRTLDSSFHPYQEWGPQEERPPDTPPLTFALLRYKTMQKTTMASLEQFLSYLEDSLPGCSPQVDSIETVFFSNSQLALLIISTDIINVQNWQMHTDRKSICGAKGWKWGAWGMTVPEYRVYLREH